MFGDFCTTVGGRGEAGSWNDGMNEPRITTKYFNVDEICSNRH